jgi:hypothetical protein
LEPTIGERIFTRFLAELAAENEAGERLAGELQKLYAEHPLDQEKLLISLMERLAQPAVASELPS